MICMQHLHITEYMLPSECFHQILEPWYDLTQFNLFFWILSWLFQTWYLDSSKSDILVDIDCSMTDIFNIVDSCTSNILAANLFIQLTLQ